MTASSEAEPARPPLSRWVCVGVGAAAAFLGLLPWVVTGMRLPIQNLWATDDIDRLPISFLPFSQYAVTTLVGLLVTGSAIGALAVRITSTRRRGLGFAATLAGVLALQSVATVQTAVVVRSGLAPSGFAAVYFWGMLTGIVLSIAVGALVAWLLAKAPPAGAIVGASVAGMALSYWVSSVIFPVGSIASPPAWLSGVPRWIPAVVVGASIAWWGIGSAGRAIAAAAGLLLLWIAPALATGAGNALGARVYAGDPAQMLDFGIQVTRMALFIPEIAIPPLLLALIVAALGLVARRVVLQRREPA